MNNDNDNDGLTLHPKNGGKFTNADLALIRRMAKEQAPDSTVTLRDDGSININSDDAIQLFLLMGFFAGRE